MSTAMSSSPDPRGPDATVTDLASAAVLGALLWDPRRVQDVMDWLEPADFPHPMHRAVYATLVGLVAAGEPVNLLELPATLASGRFHDVHVDPGRPGPLGAAGLHTLLSFTPATPRAETHDGQHHSEHVRYGQLVLEDSVRRQVHAAGVRLEQHAREAIVAVDGDPSLPGYEATASAIARLEPVLDTIERHLEHLNARLDRPAGGDAAPGPDPAATQRARSTAARRGDGQAPVDLQRAELAVIGGCLAAPDLRRTALIMLTPDDFTTPRIAATWTALTTLAGRGEPVDFVLLAAAVQRHGTSGNGAQGMTPAELFRLAQRGDRGLGNRAVQTVARAALCRAMSAAQVQIAAAAADPTLAARHVIQDARTSLRRAQATARRLLGEPEAAASSSRRTPAVAAPINTAAGTPRSVRSSAPPTPVPVYRHR